MGLEGFVIQHALHPWISNTSSNRVRRPTFTIISLAVRRRTSVAAILRAARSRDTARNPLRARAIVAPSAAAVVESRRAHASTEGATTMERKKASDFRPEVLSLF